MLLFRLLGLLLFRYDDVQLSDELFHEPPRITRSRSPCPCAFCPDGRQGKSIRDTSPLRKRHVSPYARCAKTACRRAW